MKEITELEKKSISERMASFINQEVGVPKLGQIRLMAPLAYEESVRLYNAVQHEFPSVLYSNSGIAGREAVAATANEFLTKIDRVKKD